MALVQTGRRGVVVNVDYPVENGGPGSGPKPGGGRLSPIEQVKQTLADRGHKTKQTGNTLYKSGPHPGELLTRHSGWGSNDGKTYTKGSYPDHAVEVTQHSTKPGYNMEVKPKSPTANASKAKPMEKSPDPADNDPVYAAKQQTEMAKAQEKDAMAKKQLENDHVKAKEMSTDARSRSKDAFETKPNTKAGKDAHATAAMAHDDAAGAYSKLAGAGSGNDIETRGKCQKMADKHAEQSEKHKSLAEGTGGFGGPAMNSGSRSVVVTVNRDIVVGGLDDDWPEAPVINMWSDAAREAAASARSSGSNGNQAQLASTATATATDATKKVNKGKSFLTPFGQKTDSHVEAANLHTDAQHAHDKAAASAGTKEQKAFHEDAAYSHKRAADEHMAKVGK
jgi:hypothetical protein